MQERTTGFSFNTMQGGKHRCSTRRLCAGAPGEMSDHASSLALSSSIGSTVGRAAPQHTVAMQQGSSTQHTQKQHKQKQGTRAGSLQVELKWTGLQCIFARPGAWAVGAHAVQRDGHHSASLPSAWNTALLQEPLLQEQHRISMGPARQRPTAGFVHTQLAASGAASWHRATLCRNHGQED